MAHLSLRKLSKSYDQHQVVGNINLDIKDGEFMVFVGPSGCGKSTLLRMIAGLEEISGGDLYIGDRHANDLSPSKRGVAMVFQSYALYPHMSVYANMAFSLKMAGVAKDKADQLVRHAAEVLQITHLLERKPKELSGGQRQRVAIGRSIVRKPDVFLFDEPLSNLDASLRVQMRIELTKLHKELGTTMIYVTHDQVEAMTLGDRIVVFKAGNIEQIGSPLELYNHPANLFVAGFLGSPNMNFLAGRVQAANPASHVQLEGGASLTLPAAAALPANTAITVGVRPEHLRLVPVGQGLAAQVDLVEHLGDMVIVYVSLAGHKNSVAIKLDSARTLPTLGEAVGIAVDGAHCHCFDEAGQAIR